MTVNETLAGLGSWSLRLADETPDEVISQLQFFGHVAVIRGRVDVTATSSSLLSAARYVGVLRDRSKDRRTLEGDGMLFWLGDEDDKGKVLETAVNLAGATLAASVAAVLPPAVHTGTINSAAGTYTGKHQYETPRSALDTITQAFGVEYRVNGSGTIDVGTQAQLYRTSPIVIIAAKNAGQDMDLTSLGASFDVDETVRDYSSRILLLGSSFDNGTTTVFATGSADAPSVPYLDPWGNAVQFTRMISESGTTTGSVTARAQLQLNRFNRAATALKVTATDYQIGGGQFQVGDNAYVYDPANGIQDTARSIDFRGELIHPDVVRITGATWPVTDDHTVAFRTNAGAWVDLTPWVVWESGGGEITVGDLPKSLTSGGGNPVQDRADSLPDATVPTAPSGLTLTTSAVVDPRGQNAAIVSASWTAPTLNTDGSVITDLANYVVQYRPTFRAPQWDSRFVVGTSIDLPATIDLDYDVRVAAQDRSGHVGAFTALQTIHASVDTTAPTAPSDPVVTSYIGILRIFWDGLTNVGGAMPADFNRVDVHVSATSGFTPSAATLTDSLSTKGYAGAIATPYGSLRYVKFIAYDNAGNASAPSGQTSGSTVQAADGDIQTLNVGKLVAGTMSADVVTSGRFATALTGARRELNAVGLQAWDASNNLIINLDGVNNLLTGKFQTALTGRRIEIGAAGSSGKVDFIAPDGTTGVVAGFTSSLGSPGEEAIEMGMPLASVYPAWNKVQNTEGEEIFLSSGRVQNTYGGGTSGVTQSFSIYYTPTKGTTSTVWTSSSRYLLDETNMHRWYTPTGAGGAANLRMWITPTDFIIRHFDSGQTRFWVNSTQTNIRDPDGNSRFLIDDGPDNSFTWPSTDKRVLIRRDDVSPQGSAQIQIINPFNFGITLRHASTETGTLSRLDVLDATAGSYQPVWASAFTVSSSEKNKSEIADLGPGSLNKLTRLRSVKFNRKGGKTDRGKKQRDVIDSDGNLVGVTVDDAGPEIDAPDKAEIGLIAEEVALVAPELVEDGGDAGPLIGVMPLISLLIASVQEIAADVADLKKGGKK